MDMVYVKNYDYYIFLLSIWLFVSLVGVFVMLFGVVLWMVNDIFWMFVIGFLIMFYSMWGWWG